MRLSRLLQRCPPGRSVRMLPKAEDTTVEVGMEAIGGATITTPKVDVEGMREEVDLEEYAATGEAEEEEVPEEASCREAGETVVEEGEEVTIRATFQMQEVIRGEEGEVGTEELGTMKELSRNLASMEEEEEEEVTMTVTTKMGAGIRRGEGVEEVGVAGEEEVEEEEDKEEVGEGEGGIILTKEDSLNSSSNMAGNTTAKLALIKADTTLAEDRLWGIAAESTQRWYMPYHFEFLSMVNS